MKKIFISLFLLLPIFGYSQAVYNLAVKLENKRDSLRMVNSIVKENVVRFDKMDDFTPSSKKGYSFSIYEKSEKMTYYKDFIEKEILIYKNDMLPKYIFINDINKDLNGETTRVDGTSFHFKNDDLHVVAIRKLENKDKIKSTLHHEIFHILIDNDKYDNYEMKYLKDFLDENSNYIGNDYSEFLYLSYLDLYDKGYVRAYSMHSEEEELAILFSSYICNDKAYKWAMENKGSILYKKFELIEEYVNSIIGKKAI